MSKCVRCGRFIHEGDTGWFNQVPIVEDAGGGLTLTFMDRVDKCDDGEPHVPEQERPSITCWRCGRISYNPNDIKERYCSTCHSFSEAGT